LLRRKQVSVLGRSLFGFPTIQLAIRIDQPGLLSQVCYVTRGPSHRHQVAQTRSSRLRIDHE